MHPIMEKKSYGLPWPAQLFIWSSATGNDVKINAPATLRPTPNEINYNMHNSTTHVLYLLHREDNSK
jgi:hypothetical protein